MGGHAIRSLHSQVKHLTRGLRRIFFFFSGNKRRLNKQRHSGPPLVVNLLDRVLNFPLEQHARTEASVFSVLAPAVCIGHARSAVRERFFFLSFWSGFVFFCPEPRATIHPYGRSARRRPRNAKVPFKPAAGIVGKLVPTRRLPLFFACKMLTQVDKPLFPKS